MSDQKILEIKGLKTTFHVNGQEIRAVDGIDFHVLKGETIGIVGESGSGKSVTALSVMQLVSKPGVIAAGEICYFPENGDSVNLAALSEKAMQTLPGRPNCHDFSGADDLAQPRFALRRTSCRSHPVASKNINKKSPARKP